MELVAAATLWGLFSAWLLFPPLHVPHMLRRAVGALIWAELLALGFWSYGSEGCRARPCATLAEVGRAAAGQDIPALSVAVVGMAVAFGTRRHRRSRTAPRA
jgi:hypothetical protein